MIELAHITKTYRKDKEVIRAIDGITLAVDPGECIVIRGPSGSGKSTLLNLVAGLCRPTAGEIHVAGEPLSALGAAAAAAFRAKNIGMVFQMFHLIPYLNALENVLLPVLAPPPETPQNALENRARELLDGLGLADRLRHLPSELSAGEKQRVAIARAVLRRPPVLLADEPTGNLDPANAIGVMKALLEFQRQGGTLLLVTHQKEIGTDGCRELFLKAGRIVPAG